MKRVPRTGPDRASVRYALAAIVDEPGISAREIHDDNYPQGRKVLQGVLVELTDTGLVTRATKPKNRTYFYTATELGVETMDRWLGRAQRKAS